MLHDGGIVVEEQLLPVGAEALDGIAIGIRQVIGVGVEGCLSAVDILLILKNGVVRSTGYVTVLPGCLPAIREIVVDLCLTHLTLLGGDEYHTVGSARTIDGTRGSIFQHLDTLDIIRVHRLQTVLVGWHAVNNIKRVRVINSTRTTHADHRLGTRLT